MLKDKYGRIFLNVKQEQWIDKMSNENDVKNESKQEFVRSKYDLNTHIARMLWDEPFFASISRRVTKVKDWSISTAGVYIDKKRLQFKLLYNPNFFDTLNDTQKIAVIKHELYHIILGHVTNRSKVSFEEIKKDENNKNSLKNTLEQSYIHKLWNISTDAAINSFLKDDLKGLNLIIPGEKPLEGLELFQSAEWYYEKIKNTPNDDQLMQTLLEKLCRGGIHLGWEDIENSDLSDYMKERLKQILSKARDEADANPKGWGSVSADIKKYVNDFLKNTISWRSVLNNFVRKSQKSFKYSSIRKINKRYPYIHAGKRNTHQAKIAVCFDQSGSMSDELVAEFFSELKYLVQVATFTMIPFDHDVAKEEIKEYKVRTGKIDFKRVKCGGTSFDPPTEYINEKSFDGAIFLTDMEAPKPLASKCQRLWIVPEGTKPYFSTNELVVEMKK